MKPPYLITVWLIGCISTPVALVAQPAVLDDPKDLTYVERLLRADSHKVLSSFFGDVGRFSGTVKIPSQDEPIYVIKFDRLNVQYFCGHPQQDVSSLQPGEMVYLAGKVLTDSAVFVLQNCELERATPHQKAIADEINR